MLHQLKDVVHKFIATHHNNVNKSGHTNIPLFISPTSNGELYEFFKLYILKKYKSKEWLEVTCGIGWSKAKINGIEAKKLTIRAVDTIKGFKSHIDKSLGLLLPLSEKRESMYPSQSLLLHHVQRGIALFTDMQNPRNNHKINLLLLSIMR
jgi:hypothetical protein